MGMGQIVEYGAALKEVVPGAANFPVEMHTHTILGELGMYITFRLNIVNHYPE